MQAKAPNEQRLINQRLFDAAQRNDQEVISRCLELGADISYCDEETGYSPLMVAVVYGHIDTVRHLLQVSSIDVDQWNVINLLDKSESLYSIRCRVAALYMASMLNQVEIVQVLLRAGAQVNRFNNMGWIAEGKRYTNKKTALHMAAQLGYLRVVKILIQAHADFNLTDKRKRTALYLAGVWGNIEVIQFFHQIKSMTFSTFEADKNAMLNLLQMKPIEQVLATENVIAHKPSCKGTDITYKATGEKTIFHEIFELKFHVKLEQVRLLLELGLDKHINAVDYRNDGILLLACKAVGKTEDRNVEALIQMFLDAGADVNQLNNDDTSPLHAAAEKGNVLIMKMLINAGALVNQQTKYANLTPLHYAVLGGHFDAVKVLFGHPEIDISVRASRERTLIDLADERNNPELYSFLNKAVSHTSCVEPQHENQPEVPKAAERSSSMLHAEASELLAHILEENSEQVGLRLRNGDDANVIESIYLDGDNKKWQEKLWQISPRVQSVFWASPGARCIAPLLYYAVGTGNLAIVRLLVSAGADVNHPADNEYCDAEMPLHVAARLGHIDIAEYLLKVHAAIDATDSCGKTALCTAGLMGHFPIVRLLQSYQTIQVNLITESDLSVVNYLKKHSFSQAQQSGDIIARSIYHRGADLEYEYENGIQRITLLSLLAYKGDSLSVARLLEMGVSIDKLTYPGGHTPLQCLIFGISPSKSETLKTLKLLLEAGVDVNHKNKWGKTALHLCVEKLKLNCLKFLLDNTEADVNKTDDFGNTPLHLAVSLKRGTKGVVEAMVVLLLNAKDIDLSIVNKSGKTVMDSAKFYNPENKEVIAHIDKKMQAKDCDDLFKSTIARLKLQ